MERASNEANINGKNIDKAAVSGPVLPLKQHHQPQASSIKGEMTIITNDHGKWNGSTLNCVTYPTAMGTEDLEEIES